MTLQVDFWQMVLLLIAFFGAVAGALGFMFRQFESRLGERFTDQDTKFANLDVRMGERFSAQDGRFASLEASAREETGQWARVERELLTLKADLPLHYVRREDYIRGQSVIEAKLDGLALKIENVKLRGANSA